jgi:hypothetical protein
MLLGRENEARGTEREGKKVAVALEGSEGGRHEGRARRESTKGEHQGSGTFVLFP